ncbi:MAG: hypothetical protein ACI9YT_001781 [Halobacteriales archaeon]|jgi:hypothetical protein
MAMSATKSVFADVSSRSLAVRGGIVLVLSMIGNAVVLALVQAREIAPDFRALSFPPVLFLSAVGAVGAAAVYWVLERRVDYPARTFRRIAAAVLVVPFGPDLALLAADEAATMPGVIALMLMHVVVAAVAVGVLAGWTGEAREAER